MDSVITIPALGDNFIYLYRYNQNDSFAVDPSDGFLVLKTMKQHSLNLKMILLTHHHWDHVAGIGELKRKTGCKVIGADKRRIPGIDSVVADGQILPFANRKVRVITTPGHTLTSVCYYMEPLAVSKNGILWTGDTLFIGGCGRLLECNAQTMWDSLQKLAALPNETHIYCGHDYTLENYQFALEIEPHNKTVQKRFNEIKQKHDGLTVPSTMSQEKQTNIFLRAGNVETFAELRRRKDIF